MARDPPAAPASGCPAAGAPRRGAAPRELRRERGRGAPGDALRAGLRSCAPLDYGAPHRRGCARRSRSIPLSAYPLFAAARVFAETPDPAREPHRAGIHLPGVHPRSEPALALARARGAARQAPAEGPAARAALRRGHRPPDHRRRDVPLWARQMEIFILEDMNELRGGPHHARRAAASGEQSRTRTSGASSSSGSRSSRSASNSVRTSTPLSES